MAKVDWVLLCERAIIEARSNTISLVALMENLNIPAPPPEISKPGRLVGVPFRFYVVQQWLRSRATISERVPARLALKGPDNKQISITEFNVDLTAAPKARVITQASGFTLAGEGIYRFLVQARQGSSWRTLREAELNVVFLPGSRKPITRH